MDSSQEKRVFFHVGLPKTGSTFLQLNVFPKFRGVEFVKKPDFKKKDKIIENTPYDNVLLSIEISPDKKNGLEKIKDVASKYPNTYPIIVLRRHGSWLKSKYKYYLRKHGQKTFRNYYNPDDPNSEMKKEHLEYYPKIELLWKYFKNKPLVIFQEELKTAPFRIIDLLAEFVGANYDANEIQIKTVKKAYSEKQLKYVRRFNVFYNFRIPNCSATFCRKVYKKISAFFLHTIAYVGRVLPSKAVEDEVLIPEGAIRKVNDEYKEDWKRCMNFAKQDRKIYLENEI